MMRPFTKQDAILQPVASWGDRVPHATIMPCPSVLVNVRSCRPERGLPVRERAGRTQGDRAHLRISAYIGVCNCGQTAVSKNGRASGREEVGQDVEIAVVAGSL